MGGYSGYSTTYMDSMSSPQTRQKEGEDYHNHNKKNNQIDSNAVDYFQMTTDGGSADRQKYQMTNQGGGDLGTSQGGSSTGWSHLFGKHKGTKITTSPSSS